MTKVSGRGDTHFLIPWVTLAQQRFSLRIKWDSNFRAKRLWCHDICRLIHFKWVKAAYFGWGWILVDVTHADPRWIEASLLDLLSRGFSPQGSRVINLLVSPLFATSVHFTNRRDLKVSSFGWLSWLCTCLRLWDFFMFREDQSVRWKPGKLVRLGFAGSQAIWDPFILPGLMIKSFVVDVGSKLLNLWDNFFK